MKRYPHTATIRIETETDNGSGIPEVQVQTVEVQGRYEPASQNRSSNLDQSAKFFCSRLEILKENPLILNGKKLNVNGEVIGISQGWNYQTHCELWLD